MVGGRYVLPPAHVCLLQNGLKGRAVQPRSNDAGLSGFPVVSSMLDRRGGSAAGGKGVERTIPRYLPNASVLNLGLGMLARANRTLI